MSKGIDIPIDALVAVFNSNLWSTKNNSFYGRVFRNERFGSFPSVISPEVYISADQPALEVLKNDSYDAQCFFDVQPNDPIAGGSIHTSTVWICFMVNLVALYPTLTRTEATEQVHRDAERIIEHSKFDIDGLVRGFEGFTSYDWGGDSYQAKADMHPNYCFRFNTKIEYVNC